MDNKNKTLLKTTDGIDIFVDDSGKFSAKINGREVSKRTLRDIEKEISKTSKPVVAYEIREYSGAKKVEVVGFEKGRARLSDGSLDKSYTRFYLLSDHELARIEELSRRYRAILEEWKDLESSFARLNDHNFESAKKSFNS